MRTLGNLGYSSVQCKSVPLAVEKLSFACPYGTIGQIYDYGVNLQNDGGDAESCIETEHNRACKPNNPAFSSMLDDTLGKQSVQETLTASDLYTDTTHGDCLNDQNLPTLFVQFSCVQSDEEISTKYNQLAVLVSVTILIALLF